MSIQHRNMLTQIEHILDCANVVISDAEKEFETHGGIRHEIAESLVAMRDDVAGMLVRINDGGRQKDLREVDLQLRILATADDRHRLSDYESRASRIIDALNIGQEHARPTKSASRDILPVDSQGPEPA